MKNLNLILSFLFFLPQVAFLQNEISPCSTEKIMEELLKINPDALAEQADNERFIKDFIEEMRDENSEENFTAKADPYVIPVVLHVFHWGDNGKIDLEQAQSGIDIMNDDFNGRNDGWNTIEPQFDSIKAALEIEFCLAQIDPDGNPTTGVNYYEDENLVYNNGDFYRYAWDNFKYLNIYLPKYHRDSTSNFTANATFPSESNSLAGRDRILYSSIRWGIGSHSQHEQGDDWASVGTHEAGHWLNLAHTFSGGCSNGDNVADTPPTIGGTIYLTGCKNNDFSCGVATNGSNFMDYNHDCKKMFTQGQVERMTAALHLSSRAPLWSQQNLEETGCAPPSTDVSELSNQNEVFVYPNPADDFVNFKFKKSATQIRLFDAFGKVVFEKRSIERAFSLDTRLFATGLYFYSVEFEREIATGKFILK